MNSTTQSFESLKLDPRILKILIAEGYQNPTPIQGKAIPIVLEGKDLIGCAQTGTGKTAAFALPILQHLMSKPAAVNVRGPEALVLTPTRELAIQVQQSFTTYGKASGTRAEAIFGGVKQRAQVEALRRYRPRILIATPGRLFDLMRQRIVNLSYVKMLVLDEADRMLDMGFIQDVREIVKIIPRNRQTLMFSATMPKDIQKLAEEILQSPEKVAVDPVSSTAQKIDQFVYFVANDNKRPLLAHLLKDEAFQKTIVFTRTKHIADRVSEYLHKNSFKVRAFHSNKSQNARQTALKNFMSGDLKILVASDIAARGIDVEDISHVINFDMPEAVETYVHRIGRTGRANKTGIAISFCDPTTPLRLFQLERHLGRKLDICTDHPFHLEMKKNPSMVDPYAKRGGGGRNFKKRSSSERRNKNNFRGKSQH